ncbi:bZIP transcription factor 17-like [Telopea speciosissima]|uniref:bZIP transcription factor 17-like n=1 Tax=Telopea speciosissima TaxID=54955 RepID=UPI001CC615EC|nr:bZIP transcription factor 17-like [Telopea speciosissima]
MACQEHAMYGLLPETDPPNPNPSTEYDSLPLPPLDYDYFSDDLNFPAGFAANLGFDGDLSDIDFTLDDFILSPENGLSVTGDLSDSLSWQNSKATDGSGVSSLSGGFDVAGILNSPSPETGSCNRGFSCAASSDASAGCGSGFEEDKGLNSLSPDSGCCNGGQSVWVSSSPNSSNNASDIFVDQKIKSEGVANGYMAKRKKAKEDCNTDPRSCKFRKSENTNSMCSNGSLNEEEEKKKARLMRNRESAQLSRQRKKHYVEELEDKIRSMHSTITELNNKISYFMAENASLRQQLSGGGICPPPTGIYPPPPIAPMAYAWLPYASYPVKPQGSQVPLVPIPKLKPQQVTTKTKKTESKKVETKTKKVASVSLLGVLFFMFLFGFLVPFVNDRYGVNEAAVNSGLQFSNKGVYGNHQGRVLTVIGRGNESDHNVGVRLSTEKSFLTGVDGQSMRYKRDRSERVDSEAKQNIGESHHLPLRNASEPLIASLYVPRNDKLVKIDGNLIIQSVLASEKAMKSSHAASELKDKGTASSAREARVTGLAIASKLPPVLGVSQAGRNAERLPSMYRNLNDRQRALAPSSGDTDKDNSKLSTADGSLQQWFREGLAGPILSSGVCTEVFQFIESPASVNAAAIVPVTTVTNSTTHNPPHSSKRKNRRILDRASIPLARSSENKTEEHFGGNSNGENFQGNKSVSPLIVSVLVDPRDAGDVDVDGVISSKSLSRIFVVVLLDSVKYVTYSCVLPLKGSGPHLVTT